MLVLSANIIIISYPAAVHVLALKLSLCSQPEKLITPDCPLTAGSQARLTDC